VRHPLVICALVCAWAAAAPRPAFAQTEVAPPADDSGPCTISCGCTEAMCGCSRKGGSGGACRTNGETCTVFACPGSLLPAGSSLAFAGDGSVVTVRPGAEADGPGELSSLRPVRWRTVSRGHSVGVDCQGAVVAEYFDARSAAATRRHSRTLTM